MGKESHPRDDVVHQPKVPETLLANAACPSRVNRYRPVSRPGGPMSASLIGHLGSSTFRLATMPVSMSLTGSCFSSKSAPRPFHDGDSRTKVEQSLPRPCRQTKGRFKRTYELPHPSSHEGHHSTARWSSSFLLSDLILHGFHAAAVVLASTGIRCRQPRYDA